MIVINQLMSAILQVAVLTLVPFAVYLAVHRTARGFFAWIGFTRAKSVPWKAMAAVLFGFLAAIVVPYIWLYSQGTLTYTGFTVDAYREYGWGIQTIAVILIWAIVQTSLSEEIFFRGFLGKRLSGKLGWKAGTGIQAALFGLVHISSVWGHGVLPIVIIFLITGGIGFMLGWLCLRKADGSILYGWPVHAAVNIISPVVVFSFLL